MPTTGIFVTKDFGQNWTDVHDPDRAERRLPGNPAIPTTTSPRGDGLSHHRQRQFPQGNYNIAIAVDPTDPSVIYVGGTADGNQTATGLIRINLTDIWDAHSLVAYAYDANDGGK